MSDARKYDPLRVRSCADCRATVVTAAELARHKLAFVPAGMRLFAGAFYGRPYCAACLPAGSKGVGK